MKRRGRAAPVTSTPVTSPSASSGTPISESRSSARSAEILDVGRIGVRGQQRLARRGHAAGEALAERDRRGRLGAGRAARGGAHHQPPVLLDEEDRRRVGAEHPAHARDEVLQDVVDAAMRERRVDQQLHAADHLRDALGLRPRRLLAQQRLALLLPPLALADVADEGGGDEVVADAHARDHLLGGEGGAVATLEVELDAHDAHGVLSRGELAPALRRDRRGHPAGRSPRAAARPTTSPAGQPNMRSAAAFQVVTRPSLSIARKASGALSSTSRVRDSLRLSSRPRASAAAASARSAAEQPRDQQRRRPSACRPPAASG